MKKILLLSILLNITLWAQFESIREFPYQSNPDNGIGQLLNLGQNHLVYFFPSTDSLKLSHSYDGGATWNQPVGILSGTFSWVEVNKIQSDRILVAYGGIIPKIIYSDNEGVNWSDPIDIPYSFPLSAFNAKFYQLNDIYAAATKRNYILYSTSADGLVWSDLVRFSVLPTNVILSTILNFEADNILYATTSNGTTNSTLKLYTSPAISQTAVYQSTILETDSGKFITNLYGVKSNNKYWIAFTLESDFEGTPNKDIYFISRDTGATQWTEPVLFAKSYRNDNYAVLSEFPISPFISFVSSRFSTNSQDRTQIFYGQLGVSDDIEIIPFIKKVKLNTVYNYPVDMTITPTVKSFSYNQLSKVTALIDGGELMQLYDDGLHNDGLANDSIFGNTTTIPIAQNNQVITAQTEDVSNYSAQDSLGIVNPVLVRNDDMYTFANANSRFSIYRSGDIGNYGLKGYPTAFDDRPIVFGGGFFLSGYNNGNLWANGIARAISVFDYLSGSVGGSESKLYVVKKNDSPFSQSWQNWSEAVALGAYFYDGDGDGIYNPVDLNSNGIWDSNEDAPDILGDETVWCVYNDGVPAAQRWFNDMEPQGIEIRHTTWTYTNDENLRNVYFVRYSILNTGTVVNNTDSVYFGFWSDPDVGDVTDNYAGSDSLINSGFCYADSHDQSYGSNAPAAFQTILQTPWKLVSDSSQFAINYKGDLLGIDTIYGAVNLKTTSFISYGCGQGPWTAQEARYELLGRDVSGIVVDPCTWPLGQVYGVDCSTIDGHWMYSGNPIDSVGWLDYDDCDARIMINTGPFELKAGKPIDIIASYHFERGNTNLESITLGKDEATYLLHNTVVSVSDNKFNNNIVTEYKLYQNYPNPFNPSTTIRYSIPNITPSGVAGVRVQLNVYDILGGKVATLVDEVIPAGNYEVTFDASRLSSGVYFYQLKAGVLVETKKMILLK